jgi:hypothetical protein
VIAFLIALLGVLVGAFSSPRIGAIMIAISLAVFVYPNFGKKRASEKVIVLALFVSLVTVALALPRR